MTKIAKCYGKILRFFNLLLYAQKQGLQIVPNNKKTAEGGWKFVD